MKNTTTIQFNDEICTIESQIHNEPWDSKQRHTILYVHTPFDPEELNDSGITRHPEYSRKGDNPVLDKEWRKYNKAELATQKRIIDQAVKDGLIDADFVKELKWSKKAGCACGCSPGWKARDYRRRSMWLHCTAPSKEREKEERKAAYRAEQEAKTLSSMVI